MSKQLSIIEVERIANLARIELTADQKQRFCRELSAILDYVAQLNELDIVQVESTSQVTGLKNIYRADEIKNNDPDQIQALIKSAPDEQAGYIKVKAVF